MTEVGKRIYKHAAFDGAAGDITLVKAVANHRIAVHAYVCTSDTANGTIRFESEAAGTALTGIMETSIDSPIVVPFSEVPWFITDAEASGTDDDLSLEAVQGASGHIIYSLIRIRDD